MEYKIHAVKLAKEIGGEKAAAELGIPENTMYVCMDESRKGGTTGHRFRLTHTTDRHESAGC